MGSLLKRNALKNIIKVAFSNIAKLFSGVLVGLLLPKIIGVTDYGYYKTFTLYGVYVGLFTFGITDGIYLKIGGQSYENLNKTKFRSYIRFFLCIELIFSSFTAIISCLLLPGEYRFIFLCLAVYLLFYNVICFFQNISQAIERFSELSIRNLLYSFLQACVILFMYFSSKHSISVEKIQSETISFSFSSLTCTYHFYTIAYVSITILLAFWYIYTYRDLIFGKSVGFKNSWADIRQFIKIGTPLLISNICMLLLLSLDKQFVNILFSTDEYAVYAFAYNILSLFSTTLAAISTVLYPMLKRADTIILENNYPKLVFSVMTLSFAGTALYFPLIKFIPWFLPKYTDALPIFRIIIPGLAISSSVTIIMHNYYKVLGKNTRFFINCLLILLTSFILNLIAYIIFGTQESISAASIISLLLWYFISEMYLVKHNHIHRSFNALYMILMLIIFYLVSMIEIWWLSMILYIIFLLIVTILFQKILANRV